MHLPDGSRAQIWRSLFSFGSVSFVHLIVSTERLKSHFCANHAWLNQTFYLVFLCFASANTGAPTTDVTGKGKNAKHSLRNSFCSWLWTCWGHIQIQFSNTHSLILTFHYLCSRREMLTRCLIELCIEISGLTVIFVLDSRWKTGSHRGDLLS